MDSANMDCLKAGFEGAKDDNDEIKANWIRYNQEIKMTVKTMATDKTRGIWKSVCSRSPHKNIKIWKDSNVCLAHIFTAGNTVTSVNLVHTCSDALPGRKRQYTGSLLSKVSGEIREMQDNMSTQEPVRGATIQEYMDKAKAAGFEVRKSQAYRHVQGLNVVKFPIEARIGQYFLLTKMFKVWKRTDSGGSYEIDTEEAPWDDDLEVFERSYIAPSFCKEAWQHTKFRFVVLDSTFKSTARFGRTFFLAVAYDGNNEALLIGFAVCHSETSNLDNWSWFLQNLMRDFPGIQTFLFGCKLAMENSNVLRVLKLTSTRASRCVLGLIADCPAKLSKTDRLFLQGHLAMACTERVYNAYLEVFKKRNAPAAAWFDEHKEEFATFSFIEEDHLRFGHVANDVGEDQLLKPLMGSIEELPIATMFVTLLSKLAEIHVVRKNNAKKLLEEENQISGYVRKIHEKNIADAENLCVQTIYNKDCVWKGYVSYDAKSNDPLNYLLVRIDTNAFTANCPCQWATHMGCPCVHSVAFIVQNNLDPSDARWFHPHYHTSTLATMYGAGDDSSTLPDFSACLTGKFSVVPMSPPLLESRTELSASKRRKYTPTSNKDMLRTCKSCGEKGHNHKTCANPSTQYQYERFYDDAKKWAKSQTEVKAVATSVSI